MEELKKSLELRKENLIFLLKNKKDYIELEKQHQIYGAIKEIDYIMRMMHYSAREEDESFILTQEEVPARKIAERVRKFKSPIRIRFSKEKEQ